MSSKQDEEIKINGFLGEGDKLTSYLLGQEGHKQKQQPSGDWYHASFHTLTTVVGAGVLGLPWAFSYLSSFYAILFLFGSLSFSLYTGYQLAYMHEDEDGSRHNSYIALGQRVLGRRKGNWGVLPFQYSILLGSAITKCPIAQQKSNGLKYHKIQKSQKLDQKSTKKIPNRESKNQ
eukprot:TRINITY_DN7005_c0_g1_i9.p2 TRINITY_DN7005_c0_g1~~TRINITY_DN7005_c0_g1_i9.p2  ORF type:complete len:200 (-),score=10.24 TRINITY_DN7005_c0_g1_i9:66-593(-)